MIAVQRKNKALTRHIIFLSLEVPKDQTETIASLSVKTVTCLLKKECFQVEMAEKTAKNSRKAILIERQAMEKKTKAH